MTALLKEIEEKASELSVSERELLASHLFQSVHNCELSELESEWLDVAEMRFNALMDGSDKGIEETEFFNRFGIRYWKNH
ncbi:MAG: addiction module protein [Pontiellaceae bacterium]|nr:addiction module protein [Pontiellaceae bacterium]MBN2783213.1 addiction module protein [Pontiellaceae bacterium]